MADYAGKLVLGGEYRQATVASRHNTQAWKRSTRSTPPGGWWWLGFPCNQFGKQEPGRRPTISRRPCHINYGVSFPMFEKVEVNGAAAHPVFRFLKDELPGVLGGRIKWNFTKFLIGRDGKPLKRFAPIATPEKMETAILAALEL
ncbi:Glutathione peroxidase homolog BsaA [Raoultella planticola]|uniref:Glutathione peroxidase n=1 Tax=Raoultella planticola TaxID=575 RepID=A0A485A6T3_RAOPL|nr:Glutathione peroxidase homolog BsaA [Raoultella planticola]